MSRIGFGFVVAEDLSAAWIETLKMVHECPGSKTFHSVTRIGQPLVEDIGIRAGCDALIEARRLQSVDTVANTIFPLAMSNASGSPGELVQRYRASYSQVRRFGGNNKGTYFGRIVAHPSPSGIRDQLVPLVGKLIREIDTGAPMSARYEVRLTDIGEVDDLDDDRPTAFDVPIHAPHKDNSRRAFPCLSMLSFQLDGGRVRLLAQYRYEYLVSKGYGNYLGLARLLEYVATQAGLVPGEMTITAGRVKADAPERDLAQCLGQAWAHA